MEDCVRDDKGGNGGRVRQEKMQRERGREKEGGRWMDGWNVVF